MGPETHHPDSGINRHPSTEWSIGSWAQIYLLDEGQRLGKK